MSAKGSCRPPRERAPRRTSACLPPACVEGQRREIDPLLVANVLERHIAHEQRQADHLRTPKGHVAVVDLQAGRPCDGRRGSRCGEHGESCEHTRSRASRVAPRKCSRVHWGTKRGQEAISALIQNPCRGRARARRNPCKHKHTHMAMHTARHAPYSYKRHGLKALYLSNSSPSLA
eukprot:scaffold24191_cov69-Phaeocystis_antarctica.AAC.2